MSNQDITNPADEIRKEEKYSIPSLPLPYDLETKEVLKQLNRANRKLAELKGVAQTIPNERILISSLTLQEAKVSRQTASKYLDRIVALGLLKKEKMGKENYYINTRLMNLFIEFGQYKATEPAEVIESVHVNDITK